METEGFRLSKISKIEKDSSDLKISMDTKEKLISYYNLELFNRKDDLLKRKFI